MLEIRMEEPADFAAVRDLNERAFGQPTDAKIVDALRESCGVILSLVAEAGDRIVGHIFFSPAAIESPQGIVCGMALAPMAVEPELQRRGIGSMLVQRGIELVRETGCPFIIVLGHPDYYPRFGFQPAAPRGVRCQWDGVADEAFMVLNLDEAAMQDVTGVARYRPEFDEAM